MSQVDVDPVESIMNPVATQADSAGLHDAALRDETPERKELAAAVQKAIADQFTVTDAWQPRNIVKFVINCPSGQKVLVKHLNTLDLVRADLIEEIDFFTKRLMPSDIDLAGNVKDAEDQVQQGFWATLRDPEKRLRFFDMTGKLVSVAAVRPKVIFDGVVLINDPDKPDDPDAKIEKFGYEMTMEEQLQHFKKPIQPLKPGEVYAGPIDFSDRMAFFNELNKPLALIEPFREQQNAVLENLESVQSPGVPTISDL